MERTKIISIKQTFGGMDAHKSSLFLNALNIYIENSITKLLSEKYNKILSHKYVRVISDKCETSHAHFIDNKFIIYFYNTLTDYQNYKQSVYLKFNVNELFGNCSTAVINNITLNGCYSSDAKHLEYYELCLTIAEDLANLFGYTCVTYSVSGDNNDNLRLEPYLAQSYAIVDQYVNKRGGLIKIFNKLI